MRSQVMERPRVAARVHVRRKRALLDLIRISALLERQSELELSDDQVKKLLNIRADMIRAKAKLNGDIRIARLDLIYSIAANIGNINPDQIRSAIKDIYALRIERKAATVDAFKKASDVLTGDQKEKLKDMAQERLADYEESDEAGFPEDVE